MHFLYNQDLMLNTWYIWLCCGELLLTKLTTGVILHVGASCKVFRDTFQGIQGLFNAYNTYFWWDIPLTYFAVYHFFWSHSMAHADSFPIQQCDDGGALSYILTFCEIRYFAILARVEMRRSISLSYLPV